MKQPNVDFDIASVIIEDEDNNEAEDVRIPTLSNVNEQKWSGVIEKL